MMGGRLAGVRVIVNTIHGLGNIAERPGLKELLYSGMCRLSSRIVAVCPMAYRAFAAGAVIPKSKLVTINNGIPLESLLRVPAREAGAEIVFGIVGRLVPVKDHATLLDAFATILRQRPRCRLEILGDGPLRGDLAKQALTLSIDDKVLFHGFSSDVAGFLTRIDVLVLCSISEALPLSVLEAMGAALPIVGTDVGGMRDLVAGAQCGWLCPPSRADELAAALLSAASTTPAERREMGERARRNVVEHYSLDHMTAEYERLFSELRHR
jgi:glycosyltransferase involved in cell wall biosynthesis